MTLIEWLLPASFEQYLGGLLTAKKEARYQVAMILSVPHMGLATVHSARVEWPAFGY